jgi:hypothetical protein
LEVEMSKYIRGEAPQSTAVLDHIAKMPRVYSRILVRSGSRLLRGLRVLKAIGTIILSPNGVNETHEHFLMSRRRR